RGYVYHMSVGEAYRRRGVGSALVDRCLAALKDEGINKVALLVFKYNDAGNAFWERMGFSLREDVNYRNRALTELVRIDT
ncbi:MAG: GNAT family N-acetyltransferase, partial [Clostridia bacterium]|nr:GNAT family N-acetyltransferase [Clostridia bacterium]